jgi:thiaminase
MSISPEKNNVEIEKLFKWSSDFKINDKYGNFIVDVFMRLVGDAEINKARVFAIRKSAELRKLLRDDESDERIAFISTVYEMDEKEELADLISMLKLREFSDSATREVTVPFPKEPKSDAPLEDIEKYQAEVDDYEGKRMEKINEYLIAKVDNFRNSIKDRTVEQLQKDYEKLMISQLCEKEMVTKFKEYCVYCSVYRDSEFKEKFFTTFEEFDNLPTEIKRQYIENYDSLELNVDELKKSLEAMP